MSYHLVIHFARFGPYHFTRLRSAIDVLDPLGWKVSGLQTAGTDSTYAWDETGLSPEALATVFPDRVYEEIPAGDLQRGILSVLDELNPDAVAIAGWGTADARAALNWCRRHGAKAIVMSETRASDGRRVWWREWLKSRLVRRFDGALVGGKAHRDYLVALGMSAERIEVGYDIVDNGYFAAKAGEYRTKGLKDEGTERPEAAVEGGGAAEGCGGSVDQCFSKPVSEGAGDGETGEDRRSEVGDQMTTEAQRAGMQWRRRQATWVAKQPKVGRTAGPYFLASSRFIERKNLRRLVDAYADYRRRSMERGAGSGEQGGQKSQTRGQMSEARDQKLEKGGELWDLVLLGAGDGKEELERYVSVNGIAGIVFAGFQQIDVLPRWYAGAGAFVHPALEEPWGLVINEAMASGLPVICSRTTGAAELVEEGVSGFLFDPLDADALAGLLLRVGIMPEQERREMGERGRYLVEKKLPVSAFGASLAKLLGCVPS
jgi:glycosyltransferase involved in cell wall biosynthesis